MGGFVAGNDVLRVRVAELAASYFRTHRVAPADIPAVFARLHASLPAISPPASETETVSVAVEKGSDAEPVAPEARRPSERRSKRASPRTTPSAPPGATPPTPAAAAAVEVVSVASAQRPAAQPADPRAAPAHDILEAPLSRGAELLSPPDNDAEATADHATAEPTFGRVASAEGPVIEPAELQAQPADEQLEAPLNPGAELVNPPDDESKEAADHAPAEPTSEASASATPAPRPKLSLAALTSTRSWLGGMGKLGQRREGDRTFRGGVFLSKAPLRARC